MDFCRDFGGYGIEKVETVVGFGFVTIKEYGNPVWAGLVVFVKVEDACEFVDRFVKFR